MREQVLNTNFDNQIVEAFAIPPINEHFVDLLYQKIVNEVEKREARNFSRRVTMRRFAMAMVALILVIFLIIGPQRVYAAIMRLFGYIPGVGLVSESSDIRILKEPVSITREGITFSVNSMVLTPNESIVDFGAMGVPSWASANEGLERGCIELPYLLLADGTEIKVVTGEPVPTDVWEATFVVPCIWGAYEDKTPTNWRLPLNFVPAPDDYVVLPVQDVTPQITDTVESVIETETDPVEEINEELGSISIEKMIETEDGYILGGRLRPANPTDQIQQMGVKPVIRDADGKEVDYSLPMEINMNELIQMERGDVIFAWAFSGSGVTFPITLEMHGLLVSSAQPEESVQIAISIPADMQVGTSLEVQKSFTLNGYDLVLETIRRSSNGYSFNFKTDGNAVGLSVNIEGYTSQGGGGGWVVDEHFTRSLAYAQLPAGDLTLTLSKLTVSSEMQTWKTSWQPEEARKFTEAIVPEGVCWHAELNDPIPKLAGQLQGNLVVTQYLDQPQLVISALNGNEMKTIPNASWAEFSADGRSMAYQVGSAIYIQSLDSGEEVSFAGFNVRDITWSHDGGQLAFANNGEQSGIFLLNLENGLSQQLTDYGYEYIAGWSGDGQTLYYSIPGASEAGFPLFALDLNGGESTQLFILENSSLKAPYPRVSPDGQWVAYRDRENSSLYIKAMDGSDARMVMEKPGLAIGNLSWSIRGDWLAINVYSADFAKPDIVLIDPFTCEVYQLQNLWGEVCGAIVE
ncbi:MAG: hypothetical protein JEZ00_07880 [Anaerolineaceae bacterium]|nr:hypothetical protein [Anaerolineaceae bacterium]